MKIAIIGGGFYGCYIAWKISKTFKNIKIDIFEKNNALIKESGLNNQYRLHKGFHYPRSKKTILQTKFGSTLFEKEFKNFIFFPKRNLYLIHKKSKINFKNYTQIYRSKNIKFKKIDIKKLNFLKNYNEFQGGINTSEGVILLDRLIPYLKNKVIKKCNIFYNKKIIKINKITNEITDKNKKIYKDYDWIINCSYTDINLTNFNNLKIKFEIACMLRVKNFLSEPTGITIMDGPFVSLYPCNPKEISISSVIYTPYKKFRSLKGLRNFKLQRNDLKLIKKNIIRHTKKYINISNLNLKNIKYIYSPKVKVKNDIGDKRLAMISIKKKIINVLCGKLDAAPIIWNKIKNKFIDS